MVSRRTLLETAVALPLGACALRADLESGGPPLWRVEGGGRAWLMGFGEAKDRSWLTPEVAGAFDESDELWLETPPAGTFAPGTNVDALFEEIGFDEERSFYDALEPSVRLRARAYVDEFDIAPERIERMRPWLGYIAINGAFWRRHERPYEVEYPEEVLRGLAEDAGKDVRHEYETSEQVLRFFAGMNDVAQSQYVEMLLDYLDDEKLGLNEVYFGWATGELHEGAIDRMRMKAPELYQVLQVDRNAWWADKIEELIATDRIGFACVGMNHVLGPDSIQRQLERRGRTARRV